MRPHPATFLLAIGAAACATGPSPAAHTEVSIQELEVVVAPEDLLLARPRDLVVGLDGHVFVLDRQDRRVVVVDAAGQLVTTIGAPGQGPGEMRTPREIGIIENTLHVFDYARGSILDFDTDGTHRGDRHADVGGLPLDLVFTDSGVVFSSTRVAARGGLAMVLADSTTEPRIIGEAISPQAGPEEGFVERLQETRQIPEFMRNGVRLVAAADGGVWLFLHAEQLLQRYDVDYEITLSVPVTVPEAAAIRESFFDWYARIDADDVLRYFTLVADGIEVNGSLWLLWDTPRGDRGLITVHDPAGVITHRITFPPLSEANETIVSRTRFTVDPAAGKVYLVTSDASALFGFAVPGGVMGES